MVIFFSLSGYTLTKDNTNIILKYKGTSFIVVTFVLKIMHIGNSNERVPSHFLSYYVDICFTDKYLPHFDILHLWETISVFVEVCKL